MYAIRAKYQNLEREKRIFFWSFLLSLLLHLLFVLIFIQDIVIIDLTPEEKELPEEVTVVFPENKPKFIVENVNADREIPEDSDLLSDFNSRARNQQLMEERANQPMSDGNIPFANLTGPNIQNNTRNQFQTKKFSRDALLGETTDSYENNIFQDWTQVFQENNIADNKTTNNIYNQKRFSADLLGDDISLSTYAWKWAPYINAFKRKLYTVWFTPAAYHRLGLIDGYTVIQFSISRDGQLVDYKVLEHTGHESLEKSSVNAITAVFPFKPLPVNFPEEYLTITARMIYPNLRQRR
jgi:hypothetical protein